MDDFTWDPSGRDAQRDRWLEYPEVDAIEVWIAPGGRAIVAVRR